LVGIEDADTQADIDWLVGKLSISDFGDENNVMNLSVQILMDIMVVSQFTLHAATKRESSLIHKGV
jgi:D-tyrosyl-tRNA(Tyr) deacylase